MSAGLDKVEISLRRHLAAWHAPRQMARFLATVVLALPGVLAASHGQLSLDDLWAALPAAALVAVEQTWKSVPWDAVLNALAAERQKAAAQSIEEPPDSDDAP